MIDSTVSLIMFPILFSPTRAQHKYTFVYVSVRNRLPADLKSAVSHLTGVFSATANEIQYYIHPNVLLKTSGC